MTERAADVAPPRRPSVVATVGMGSFPFDRFVRSLASLHAEFAVFAQIGPSSVLLPCASARFVPAGELRRRMLDADVIVTHAGNTVREVQRLGRVPIVVARRAALGEMANDHQVIYLAHERLAGRVVAVDDVSQLLGAVRAHRRSEAQILASRSLAPAPDPGELADLLDELVLPLVRGRSSRAHRAGRDRVRDRRRQGSKTP